MDELKESVDLNTRVTAELAIALVAMWQLEAVQTVGDGTGGVIDAATIAEEQRFMEFTLPDLGRLRYARGYDDWWRLNKKSSRKNWSTARCAANGCGNALA